MERVRGGAWLLTLLAVPVLGACYDLTVTNPNEPDQERAIASAEDAVALIGASFHTWFDGQFSYYGPGMALSLASFQHSSPWACCGMEEFSRIPRVPFMNDGSDDNMVWPWTLTYRSIRAASDGLAKLDGLRDGGGLSEPEIQRARAFANFVLGLGHASIAVLYAEGFVADDAADPSSRASALSYDELMAQAMTYFDVTIELTREVAWRLPEEWMNAPLNARELERAAHSMKARYTAAVARTASERAAVNWDAVIAEVDKGIAADLVLYMDNDNGWGNDVLGYGTYAGWSELAYFIHGMADQSGNYQMWNALSLRNKSHLLEVDAPVLIVTPDLRFPQGTSVAEQRLAPGRYFRITTDNPDGTWARPDRGTWRWSWYKHARGEDYWDGPAYLQPLMRMEEMRLLKAEALYRKGDRAGAAALVNVTRSAAGLSPTDGTGTNTSCVPRLPGGACGDLWEMLKWEKRMETTFQGPFDALWYFDGRGWGDLWQGTFLDLPLPCEEASLLLVECTTTGGSGGVHGAPVSTYRWNGEAG